MMKNLADPQGIHLKLFHQAADILGTTCTGAGFE
jgi:hypothetical protein